MRRQRSGPWLRKPAIVVSLVLGMLLAGCATASAPAPEATAEAQPELVDQALPAAKTEELWLPYQYESLEFVRLTAEPETIRQLGNIFVALSHHDGISAIEVIDSQGSLLWRLERQGRDVNFALTPSPEGHLLVVSDENDDQASVAAYRLKTAESVWENVSIPGNLTGPGLVWRDADADQTSAIAPGTGQILTAKDFDGQQILGQYQALIVTATAEKLTGWPLTGAAGETPRWQLPAKQLDIPGKADCLATALKPGPSETAPQTRPLTSNLAVLSCPEPAQRSESEERIPSGPLIDLATGKVLTKDAIAVTTDSATKTNVVTKAGAVTGLNASGKPLWKVPVAPGSRVSAAGGALAYIVDDNSIRAYNTITGDLAGAYDPKGSGDIAIPVLAAPSGATVLTVGDEFYLATTNPSENTDPADEG